MSFKGRSLGSLLNSHRVLALLRPSTGIIHIKRFLEGEDVESVLDLGCGVYSPSHFASAFPTCRYLGIDSNPPATGTFPSGFHFYRGDLNTLRLEEVTSETFQLVVLSHVLEHLPDGLKTLQIACSKVQTNGLVYVSYPTCRSVEFPHRRGTLNFYDDPTHINLVHTPQVIAALRDCGIQTLDAGPSRTIQGLLRMFPEVILSPLVGGVTGPMLWDLYGFEEHVIGKKSSARPIHSVNNIS